MNDINLDENWFAPFSRGRKYAHYLKGNRWLCNGPNWIPAKGIRGLMLSEFLPHCPKCEKRLKEAQEA
jgi:hypothetical protein